MMERCGLIHTPCCFVFATVCSVVNTLLLDGNKMERCCIVWHVVSIYVNVGVSPLAGSADPLSCSQWFAKLGPASDAPVAMP